MGLEMTATQALGLWHRVTLDQVQKEGHDLTMRQLAVLLEVYLVPPPHTVRGLAATLNVTKPVITRALDTLGEMGLVDRVRDNLDRRSVIVRRTVAGALFLEKLGDTIIARGRSLG